MLDLFGLHSEAAGAAATCLLIAGLATAAAAAAPQPSRITPCRQPHREEAHQRVYWHIGAIVTSGRPVRGGLFRCAGSTVGRPAGDPRLGLVAVVILVSAATSAVSLVYQGGLGIDPAILKPGLRSKAEANNSPPASPTGSVMTEHFGEAAERLEEPERRASFACQGDPSRSHLVTGNPGHRRHRQSTRPHSPRLGASSQGAVEGEQRIRERTTSMAIPHAYPGMPVDLRPDGESLSEAKSAALVKDETFEAIRMVIPRGHEMSRHQVDGAITIYCLRRAGRLHRRRQDPRSEGRPLAFPPGQRTSFAGRGRGRLGPC